MSTTLEEIRKEMYDKAGPAIRKYMDYLPYVTCYQDTEYLKRHHAMSKEVQAPPAIRLYRSIWRFIKYGYWHPRYLLIPYQRARYGYSWRDVWNLDDYIAGIFVRAGEWYLSDKAHVVGHPNLEEFVEGWRHYVNGCDYACPKVARARQLLPEVFPSLWD